MPLPDKAALRAEMKAKRDGLDPAIREAGGIELANAGLAVLDGESGVVSSYRAMGSELDCGRLEARLRARGHQIALPVMVGRGQPLIFRHWSPGDLLADRMWGIKEPLPSAAAVEPGILLVPLLAFDRAGFRLGYGGGFYDRTLAKLRSRQPIIAIGIAFEAQEIDAVPRLDYDERLDWVLTPSGAIRCTG